MVQDILIGSVQCQRVLGSSVGRDGAAPQLLTDLRTWGSAALTLSSWAVDGLGEQHTL